MLEDTNSLDGAHIMVYHIFIIQNEWQAITNEYPYDG